MKGILYAGIIIILTGCGLEVSRGQTADPMAEGWYSQQKTDLQYLQDLNECQTRCLTA